MTTSFLISVLAYWSIAQAPVSATATVPAQLTPTIETSVDRNEILIGDVFHLNVTIERDPQIQIVRRETGLELGQFEIKEIDPGSEEKLEDGKIRQTIDYQLSTFFTGEFEIPAFDIVYSNGEGAVGTLRTSPIKITVRSLTPEEMEGLDIRDIKNPELLSGASRMWIVWSVIGGLVALLALIYAIVHYMKKRKNAAPTEPPLPPHERAYIDLKALREEPEWRERCDYEYFSTRVSEIVRVYIKGRWGIDALDETTEETMNELSALRLDKDVNRHFEEFFCECDLMKFARYQLPAEELDGLIDRATTIVDLTREAPEERDAATNALQTDTNKPDSKPDVETKPEENAQPTSEE